MIIKKVISINLIKKVISIFLLVSWLVLIYCLSAMSGDESNKKSMGIIQKDIEISNQLIKKQTNETDSNTEQETKKVNTTISNNKLKEVNQVMRKFMHGSVYLVLCLLIIMVLKVFGLQGNKVLTISILCCFLYACTDEFHQQFVDGRTARFIDILIDTAGACLGAGIYYVCKRRRLVMKKVLLIGSDGMLGSELKQRLQSKYEVYDTTIETLDITNKEAVLAKAQEIKPYFIINCAAYTNVDGCEANEELAMAVNGHAVSNIAQAAKELGATLIHISTDYVFPGNLPIEECYTEEMEPAPVSAYGRTKLVGEQNAAKAEKYYILRTAWLYGINGKNFVKTMLKLSKDRDEITVVNDQHGSPTSTTTLCSIIEQVMEKEPKYGIYHSTNEGFTTWYEFTKLIFELSGIVTKVKPITSAEYKKMYPNSSNRPTNSKLSKEKLHKIGIYPEDYEEALKKYLNVPEGPC